MANNAVNGSPPMRGIGNHGVFSASPVRPGHSAPGRIGADRRTAYESPEPHLRSPRQPHLSRHCGTPANSQRLPAAQPTQGLVTKELKAKIMLSQYLPHPPRTPPTFPSHRGKKVQISRFAPIDYAW